MKLESVAASFAAYRAAVIPPDASTVQVEECRRAYYAGVYFLLLNLAHHIGDASVSEDEGVIELEAIQRECEAFAAGLEAPPAEAPRPRVPSEQYTTSDAGEIRPILQMLGGKIGEALPAGWGFNLLLFTYGDGGSLFYLSSAEREDVIAVMREYINRQVQ